MCVCVCFPHHHVKPGRLHFILALWPASWTSKLPTGWTSPECVNLTVFTVCVLSKTLSLHTVWQRLKECFVLCLILTDTSVFRACKICRCVCGYVFNFHTAPAGQATKHTKLKRGIFQQYLTQNWEMMMKIQLDLTLCVCQGAGGININTFDMIMHWCMCPIRFYKAGKDTL